MKLIVVLELFSVFLILKAQENLNCHIYGIEGSAWDLSGHKIETPIDDTHEGEVANFPTSNITAINVKSVSENKYLNAAFKNNILTIFTTEQFKDFEKDRKGSFDSQISIEINCECADNTTEDLTIHLEVTDTNNHDPIFNKNLYEYNFGMTIPVGFDLTLFEAISASDDDFMNSNTYFTTESDEINKILKLEKTGRYDNGHYFTSLKALEDITAPFKQEFTIVVTDEGIPLLNTTATVVISVSLPDKNASDHPPVFSKHLYIAEYHSNNTLKMEENITIKYGAKENMIVQQSAYEEYFKISQNSLLKEEFDVQIIKPLTEEILQEVYIIIEIEAKNEGSLYLGLATLLINLPNEQNNGSNLHPPVFSKSHYFANYTLNHDLNMEETITIKYGATDNTIVRQSNYEEYIKIDLNASNNTELLVELIKPLNNETLENDIIVFEITAENEGLSIPTRTTLIIYVQKESRDSSSYDHVVHIFGFTIGDTIFPLVLFLSALTIIVLLNVVVLSLYFKKKGVNSSTTPTVINLHA